MDAPSCSARILQPFMRYVQARRRDRDLVPRDFWSADANGRVSLRAAQSMLDDGAERLGDARLGLKLGRAMRFGEGGAFDYAVRSAATLRDAAAVAARYATVVSDSLEIGFEIWRRRAVVRLQEPGWTRSAADFAMAVFYKIHLSDEMPGGAELECWFPYAMPEDVREHQRSFPNAKLRFNAPVFAFGFDHAYENALRPGADAVLHGVHCARADALLADLAAAQALKLRVRPFVEQDIQLPREAKVPRVARALRMSRRTMSRRLQREGTTFSAELDGARRRLALAFVADGATPLKEVAFRLGFSHAESFHRAFKRWTGETPQGFRRRTLPT